MGLSFLGANGANVHSSEGVAIANHQSDEKFTAVDRANGISTMELWGFERIASFLLVAFYGAEVESPLRYDPFSVVDWPIPLPQFFGNATNRLRDSVE